MKELIITADIHSNLEALQKTPTNQKKVLCCGDLVGYGPNPNQTINHIREQKWTSVMGNHDWASLTQKTQGMNAFAKEAIKWTFKQLTPKNRKYLAKLPRTKTLNIENKKILLVHASPRNALNEYIFNPETAKKLLKAIPHDILLFGHTHTPMIIKENQKLALNPGSIGQPRDDNPRLSYAKLTLPSMKAKIIRKEYNIKKTAQKIKQAGLPPILAERLYQGW